MMNTIEFFFFGFFFSFFKIFFLAKKTPVKTQKKLTMVQSKYEQ